MYYEITAKCVIKEPITSRYVLVMETIDGEYLMPVPIGAFEAESIYTELNGISSPRPMTFDFISQIISSLPGLNIDQILIDEVNGDVFQAKLFISGKDIEKTIDCRPSDAVALALRMDIPIYVTETVLEKKHCISCKCLPKSDENTINSLLGEQKGAFWTV